MSHKRNISHGESPPSAKRPTQAASESTDPPTDPPKAAEQFVYLAAEEQYGEHIEPKKIVFEIYATVKDANNRLLARQVENSAINRKEWQTTYDKYGCLHSVAEDIEDVHYNTELAVRRMEVKPPGSAAAVPFDLSESEDENSYDEDEWEEEEEEEEEALYARRPARTWTRNRPDRDCGGCGCGSCQNCLSFSDLLLRG